MRILNFSWVWQTFKYFAYIVCRWACHSNRISSGHCIEFMKQWVINQSPHSIIQFLSVGLYLRMNLILVATDSLQPGRRKELRAFLDHWVVTQALLYSVYTCNSCACMTISEGTHNHALIDKTLNAKHLESPDTHNPKLIESSNDITIYEHKLWGHFCLIGTNSST